MSLAQVLELPAVQEAVDLAWGYWEGARARYERALDSGGECNAEGGGREGREQREEKNVSFPYCHRGKHKNRF